MKNAEIFGNIHSIQTLGTLDGPGVRFVLFMQGCNLRCGCCHNPDTWEYGSGEKLTVSEALTKIEKYRSYFGEDGGVTLSGGEPLLQAEFAKELFSECHKRGINTCLDTSGSILTDEVKELLTYTDRVLLDIKYHTDELYKKYVGCSIDRPLAFLSYLDTIKLATTIRQVIIPTLNDNEYNLAFLNSLIKNHSCIDDVELLPFKKICKVKYDNMNLTFDFDKYDAPTYEYVESLRQKIIL